jgi:hypothetical protein
MDLSFSSKLIIKFSSGVIMKNFSNYFKKEKWAILLLSWIFLLPSVLLYAGSIKDVSQSAKQVQSIERPFEFGIVGDNRNGEKVYTHLSGGYFNYVWISVQNEKIEGEAVDLEGQVQDRFVIE